MSAITASNLRIDRADDRSGRMPFLLQVSMMTWRSLTVIFREPASVIPGLIISVFFVLVYEASLSGASRFFLPGQSYLGFILPVSIISSALSGASIAGQTIVRDIENGYFDKLLLTPISRSALLLGPMIAGAMVLVLQTALVVGVGLVMGLEVETGIPGVLAVLGLALVLGIAFAGFVVAIALRTGSAAAVGGASFLFFPLSFLAPTFTPVNLLSGWIRTASEFNPITYILEAMRALFNTGWDTEVMVRGLTASLVIAVITFIFAFFSLRARTRRK
ncbi:MAG: ABC transporter permease [Chloroflexota bacterium]|nr:ABC transporter permease [Chloroflexota bacterium]